MMTFGIIRTLFLGSKTARFVAVCLGALVGLFGWSQYQQHVGGEKREKKIIKNTIKAGKKKNAKSSKVRRRIKPAAAADSLWKNFGGAD